MINEKVDVEVYGRKLRLEIEGLTQLEILGLAQQVTDKMKELERQTKTVDSSKLAILTAIEFAADLQKLRSQTETFSRSEEKNVESMIVSLQSALESRSATTP
ncbi:MAG: cell division protein ZapA [Elusimicrobiota bacterium]|jgi:cell division protein ZapA (FtsZ GTPase activity inhibitor)